MIRTLPPKGLLVAFEDLIRASLRVDWIAHEAGPSLDRVKGSIVVAISGIVNLVRAFDVRNDHPRYSVNIMRFRTVTELGKEHVAKCIRFAEPGYDPAALDGVLQLDNDFAFTLDEGDAKPKPDVDVQPILLPVPKLEFRFDQGKPTVLPGAPTVFCDPRKFVGFEKTSQLAAWVRDQSGLRDSVAEQMEQYFSAEGAAKDIRSFISIAIVMPGKEQNDKPQVLGVLNLHSDREGILPGEKAALFVPLMTPFMLLIAHSLEKYHVLSKAEKAA